MTNAIGTGTRNVCYNAPVDERDLLSQIAGASGIGALLRRIIARGLEAENPDAARRLKEIRRQYYGGAMLVLFLCFVAFDHSDEMRRPSRTVRVSRTRREEVV